MLRNDFWCEHKITRLVYKTFINGANHYYYQCTFCFKQASDWIGRKALGHKALVAIHEDQDGYGLIYPKTDRDQKRHADEVHRHAMERYAIYLNSPEWKVKRQQALSRDHNRCQAALRGCTRQATEVHHLSYTSVGAELLCDLTSVCHHCHERITQEGKSNAPYRTLE